jgi:hypothetical protein
VESLNDLTKCGVKQFDFTGANLPTVQAAKSVWGGDLKVYYVWRELNLRTIGYMGSKLLKNHLRRN